MRRQLNLDIIDCPDTNRLGEIGRMKSGPRDAERAFDLPPGYTLVPLRESGDAFARGLAIASEAGAGTLIWVGRYDLVEFAVVLEPDEPLVLARRALFAGMNAIGDAIAAHCPPERSVSFEWPDAICFDQGLVGGARLGWPPDCKEDEVPAWLVLGVMLRAADMAELETASAPWGTSLMGAGFEMVETEALISSFARHLMTAFDQWNERGFEPIADAYLARLAKKEDSGRRGIDRNGDLLIDAPADGDPRVRASLLEGLGRVAWYDPGLRGPRLV
jgi:biotin-(acetyl-CoA carboxylase) ligase